MLRKGPTLTFFAFASWESDPTFPPLHFPPQEVKGKAGLELDITW